MIGDGTFRGRNDGKTMRQHARTWIEYPYARARIVFRASEEIVGRGEEVTELGEGASVDDLFARYGERYPELTAFRKSVVASVNQAFADWRCAARGK